MRDFNPVENRARFRFTMVNYVILTEEACFTGLVLFQHLNHFGNQQIRTAMIQTSQNFR